MSKENTRATINANIKQNGNQEITGQVLNSVLNTMVDDYAEQEKLTELSEKVRELEENGGGNVIGNLTGYKSLTSTSELPTSESTLGYLIGTHLYVYVGTGGDTNNGTYKDCGEFRGPQGNSGYQGAAGELEIVNNLTDGGADKALSAEMGKELNSAVKAVSDVVIGGTSHEEITWQTGGYLNEYGQITNNGSGAHAKAGPFWCEAGERIVFGKSEFLNLGKRSGTSGSFSMLIKESGLTEITQGEYVTTEAAYYMIGTKTAGFNAYPPQKVISASGALDTVVELEVKVDSLIENIDVDYLNEQLYGDEYVTYPTYTTGKAVNEYGSLASGQAQTKAATEVLPIKAGETAVMYAQGSNLCAIGYKKVGQTGNYTVKALADNTEGFIEHRFTAIEDGEIIFSSNTVAFEYFAPRIYHIKAVTINEMRAVLDVIDKKVNTAMLPITAPTRAKVLLGAGKKVILYGDSISSTSHNDRYKTLIEAYTGAEVYAGGFDGYTTAMLAADSNLQRIFDYDPDLIIIEVGGNETGADCGTFGAVSDQTLCTPTDITQDFNGEYMIQAVDHILRKVKAHYYNIMDRAGVELPILSTESAKREAVEAVKKPYIAIWTTLQQNRSVAGGPFSNPFNWLHKRNAIVEVCNLHGFHCIDVYAHNGIDWSLEPYYQSEQWQRIEGIYTHDGVHPNPWGYEKICNVIAGSLF